jgi:hypothetical protein
VTDSCRITLDPDVIGHGRVLAPVSPGSHIGWLCLPRFDSASVFAVGLITTAVTISEPIEAREMRFRAWS